jgi:predicted ribosomally synthesized peptide with SipW-like signal peptide
MKKILISLMVIAVAVGLVASASGAWFTDTEKSVGNSFQSGTIDIAVNDHNPWSAPFALTDMKPCDWVSQEFVISNAGNNPGPVYMHLIVGDGYDVTCTEPEEEVGGCAVNNIEDWITVDLTIDGQVVIPPDGFTPCGHIKLGMLDCTYIGVGWLEETNDTITVELSFHLQGETGNEYQGDAVAFDIEFLMTDHNAPPPAIYYNVIALENKDPVDWSIIDDDTWGMAYYDVGSLNLNVYAEGLKPTTNYQISINSPEDADWFPVSGGETMRRAMASALASDVYDGVSPGTAPPVGYNLFERGYYDMSDGGNLQAGPPADWTDGDDIGTFTTSQSGVTPTTVTTDAAGCLSASVSFPLPSGQYEYIKVTVKEDFSPWTAILMEATTPLFFNIP